MHQGLTDWIIVFNYILALKLLKWNNHEVFFIRYSDSCILYLMPAFLCSHNNMIMIIIISIFEEDNVFSITASLPYGLQVNTGINYYQTFFGLVYFCKCCKVSCAIFLFCMCVNLVMAV